MDASFLEETLTAWRDVREGLIDEVRNVPASRFDFRPVESVRSVRELVEHILEVAWFVTAELSRPDTNLRRYPMSQWRRRYAGELRDAKTKQDLVRRLRSQYRDAARAFRAMGDLGLWQAIIQFDGTPATRFQWLHHAIAQEMYHRGQLATYARLRGLEPALTRRIRQHG